MGGVEAVLPPKKVLAKKEAEAQSGVTSETAPGPDLPKVPSDALGNSGPDS